MNELMRACVVIFLLLALSGCRARHEGTGDLLVFAAASTADVMIDLEREYHAETGGHAQFSFGASRELARQIRSGARADLLVSADLETIDELVTDGLVAKADRRRIASNRLVLIVPKDSALTVTRPDDLEKVARLALGDPATVPVGTYAKGWLERAGLWDKVRERVVPMLDARSTLAAVEAGRAGAGIVYATDAASSAGVRVALEVPREDAPEIAYAAARLARSTAPASGRFLDFLTSAEAERTFARRGFVVEGFVAEGRAP